MFWLIIAVACAAAFLLTGLTRRYALKNKLLDLPNPRSSHLSPTPRGGGVAIVVVCLFFIVILGFANYLAASTSIFVIAPLTWVAFIGFLDDHKHIPARWRLLNQVGAAALLVFLMGGLPDLLIAGQLFNLGWIGNLLLVIGLVWLINLVNFMDGIDGITGIEVLSSSLISGLILVFVFSQSDSVLLNFVVVASVVGFLFWNFPPAKIFLGDVGSGFLGLMLGVLALASTHIAPQMFWVWLILLGVFIVDSTYTLFVRLLSGDRVYEAHCNHAYQHAARKYKSHFTVSVAVLLINLIWLAPWALLVALQWIDGLTATIISYIPLMLLARKYFAGKSPQ